MEQQIERIKKTVDIRQFLTKAKNGGYVCPWCDSGNGKNGTGAQYYANDNKICCFGKCEGKNWDVIDVYQKKMGCDFKTAVEELGGGRWKPREKPNKTLHPTPENHDWTENYAEWAGRLDDTTYHRGLSRATMTAYHVGFCKSWINPARPNTTPSPRLIIPVDRCHYLARYAGDGEHKFKKLYVGSNRPCFNMAALRQEKPCFIVEGEIDALSIIDAGGNAVGLGSGGMAGRFLDAVRKEPPRCPLVLLMDADGAGNAYREKLEAGLRELGISFTVAPPLPAGDKDANDFFMRDREAFRAYLEHAAGDGGADAGQDDSCLSHLDEIRAKIATTKPFSPVGFPELDRVFGGGLYDGLYVIGAISSLGKTTFSLQLADQVAAMGQDVLIFSLEMSRRELVCKSISRLTGSLSTRDVMTYRAHEAIDAAFREYEKFSGRVYIVEGVGDVTALRIREEITKHIQTTGRKPLVIIDYLQIIAPSDARATDKQNTDRAVLELKRISRDYDIPVWAISSFNRDNYSSPVNMSSFKESGAVEYSSDVLIGLQWAGMDYKDGETDRDRLKRLRNLRKSINDAAKTGLPIQIQLKVLKNRNGYRDSVYYDFTPRYNRFDECVGEPVADEDIEALIR